MVKKALKYTVILVLGFASLVIVVGALILGTLFFATSELDQIIYLRYLIFDKNQRPESYLEPNEKWKTYEMSTKWWGYEISTLTFQVPENYKVSFVEHAPGFAYKAFIHNLTINTPSPYIIYIPKHEGIITYDEAKKHYTEGSSRVKVYEFEETKDSFRVIGKRLEYTGWAETWDYFDQTILNINNNAVVTEYTPKCSKNCIDKETASKIISTIQSRE